MKIYLASPFFNDEELACVKQAEEVLSSRGYEVFSPRLHTAKEYEMGSRAWSEAIFAIDVAGIDACDLVVMLYHGQYSDSGTAWECGYAFGKGKKLVVVQLGEDSNLMVHEGSFANIRMEDLATYDFEHPEKRAYEGKMF